MADVNRFLSWFWKPSAGRGTFAVCADVEIPPVCSRPRADNTTHRASSHPLPRGLEPQSRPFDSLSATA